jgi:hypothetical protein
MKLPAAAVMYTMYTLITNARPTPHMLCVVYAEQVTVLSKITELFHDKLQGRVCFLSLIGMALLRSLDGPGNFNVMIGIPMCRDLSAPLLTSQHP